MVRQKPLIFISHSAKDPQAKLVLRKLYRELSKDYEVLLDRERLKSNDVWRRELHTWMKLCHGAVILFSEDAVKHSPWVKREATILGYRREDDEDFVLVPVLLPPIVPDDLEGGDFAPLALTAIQALASDSPEEITAKVSDVLEPLKDAVGNESPLQRVEDVVTSILEELEAGGKDPKPLFDAAARLGKRLKWGRRRYARQLARELLSAEWEKTSEALVSLAPHFRERDSAIRLLDYLKPFWVDPDAITELPRIGRLPRGRRAVCVNGVEYPFTAECYLSRACGVVNEWISIKLTQQKGYEELPDARMQLFEEEVARQVAPQVGYEEGETVPVEEIKEELDAYEAAKRKPFFIIVPEEFDDETVDALRVRFDSFSFFLFGGDPVADEHDLETRHIMLLEPKLPSGCEKKYARLIRTTRGELRRTK